VRYAFIHQHSQEFPIAMMCRLLEVSRSGCYASSKRGPSLRGREDVALRTRIEALHVEQRHAPGVIKTWHLLRAEGVNCSRNRVARIRRIAGIETRRVARFKKMRTYQKTEPPAEDLVKREFAVKLPNRVWVGDITQIATRKGPLHLAAFIDLCTHRVIGWATATSQTAKLAVTALQAGIAQQKPVASAGTSIHSPGITDAGQRKRPDAAAHQAQRRQPTAAVIRRTWRFLPSSSVIAIQLVGLSWRTGSAGCAATAIPARRSHRAAGFGHEVAQVERRLQARQRAASGTPSTCTI
jgi:transposase InsO family protein